MTDAGGSDEDLEVGGNKSPRTPARREGEAGSGGEEADRAEERRREEVREKRERDEIMTREKEKKEAERPKVEEAEEEREAGAEAETTKPERKVRRGSREAKALTSTPFRQDGTKTPAKRHGFKAADREDAGLRLDMDDGSTQSEVRELGKRLDAVVKAGKAMEGNIEDHGKRLTNAEKTLRRCKRRRDQTC